MCVCMCMCVVWCGVCLCVCVCVWWRGGVERSGKGRGYFLQPQMGDLPRSSGAQIIDLVSCVGRVPVETDRLEAHSGARRRGPLPGLGLVGTLGCSRRTRKACPPMPFP